MTDDNAHVNTVAEQLQVAEENNLLDELPDESDEGVDDASEACSAPEFGYVNSFVSVRCAGCLQSSSATRSTSRSSQ